MVRAAVGTRPVDTGCGRVRTATIRFGVWQLSVAGVLAAFAASAATTPAPTAATLSTIGALDRFTRTRRLGTVAALVAGGAIGPLHTTIAAAGIAARPIGTGPIGTRCVGTGSFGTTRFAAMLSSTVIAVVAILAARPAVTAGFAGSVARPSLAGRLAPWIAVPFAISIAAARPVPLAVTIRACVTMCGTLARRLRRCRR
jgi:hypothetical protein